MAELHKYIKDITKASKNGKLVFLLGQDFQRFQSTRNGGN